MREKDGPSAEEAAAAWFVRLRGEPVTDGDRAAFAAWRDVDPAHADAYRETERLWAALGQIDRRPGGPSDAESPRDMTTRPTLPGRRRALYCMAAYCMAAAATVATAAGAGCYGLRVPGFFADHRPGVGEQRKIVPTDGARPRLNIATAVPAR